MIYVKSFEFNYFQENTYLLYDDTKEAVLIDCGCVHREEEKELSSFIEENGLTLKHLLCTHLHLDHIFGNAFVYHKYGLSPEANKRDVDILPQLSIQVKPFGIPFHSEDISVSHYLLGNDIIRFGHSELTVIPVPGHSPGSIAFYNAKNAFIIVGDALFLGGIGRTDLWGGNQEILIAAIHDKLLSLPDETIVYSGHGPETTIINEKLNNPYL